MTISVIATVKNERETIATWFESVLMQGMAHVEYVIVDGGSTDGTWEWLQEKARDCKELQVVQVVGGRSQGRNEAIKRTVGDIIVAADAGCRYEHGWLAALTAPFFHDRAEVVAGAFGPWFMAHDTLIHYLVASSTTPAPEEFQKNWLPSSRSVAFTRERFQESGGYPEWLEIGEDVVFDLALVNIGARFAYSRTPLVFWRPQAKVWLYMKQLYRYTRGDGQANLWPRRQLIRYVAYGGGLFAASFVVRGIHMWLLLVLGAGVAVYMHKFWKRFSVFTKPLTLEKQMAGYALLPFVVALGDMAKMIGYIAGAWQRLTGKIHIPPRAS